MEVSIGADLKAACPQLVYACLKCKVVNTVYDEDLWEEIRSFQTKLRETEDISTIKQHPAIAATRQAYKKTGKDPNRYRPAGEQLRRRILQGKSLFHIHTLVDLVNLLSLETGFSIGGFDESLISWPVKGGIGTESDVYYGIGRGKINVAGIPIIRDRKGGIGTPTSDEERTAMRPETNSFFMLVNSYLGVHAGEKVLDRAEALLVKYAQASDIERLLVS